MKHDRISKTALMYLQRCDKAFYFYKRHPHLKASPDAKKQFLLDRGTRLGLLARGLFPGGIDATDNNRMSFMEAAENTRLLLEKGTEVIYEASMEWGGAGAMADILIKRPDGWEILEVKSSSQVMQHHLMDAAFQYYIFSKHIPVKSAYVLIPDKNYVFHRTLDVQKLFKKINATATAQKNLHFFEKLLSYGQGILENPSVPNIEIGEQCFRPGLCEFADYCFKGASPLHPDSVFRIEGFDLKEKIELYQKGIVFYHQLHAYSPTHATGQKPDAMMRKDFLKILKEFKNARAVCFDMEFYNGPIPFLDGHRPFENVCVAADVFDVEKNRHHTYFLEEPSLASLEHLINKIFEKLKKSNLIITFDKKMETEYAVFLESFFPSACRGFAELISGSVDLQGLLKKFAPSLPPEWREIYGLKKLSDKMGYEKKAPNGLKEGFDALMAYDIYMTSKNDLERQSLKELIVNYVVEDTERMGFMVNVLFNELAS
ncbi:MAG: CRISPR-associated protein Cas4 [Bacteroidia bacterium]|nr:CRISPR-associated protein Cas4 [Bacteroidia bacterium]